MSLVELIQQPGLDAFLLGNLYLDSTSFGRLKQALAHHLNSAQLNRIILYRANQLCQTKLELSRAQLVIQVYDQPADPQTKAKQALEHGILHLLYSRLIRDGLINRLVLTRTISSTDLKVQLQQLKLPPYQLNQAQEELASWARFDLIDCFHRPLSRVRVYRSVINRIIDRGLTLPILDSTDPTIKQLNLDEQTKLALAYHWPLPAELDVKNSTCLYAYGPIALAYQDYRIIDWSTNKDDLFHLAIQAGDSYLIDRLGSDLRSPLRIKLPTHHSALFYQSIEKLRRAGRIKPYYDMTDPIGPEMKAYLRQVESDYPMDPESIRMIDWDYYRNDPSLFGQISLNRQIDLVRTILIKGGPTKGLQVDQLKSAWASLTQELIENYLIPTVSLTIVQDLNINNYRAVRSLYDQDLLLDLTYPAILAVVYNDLLWLDLIKSHPRFTPLVLDRAIRLSIQLKRNRMIKRLIDCK